MPANSKAGTSSTQKCQGHYPGICEEGFVSSLSLTGFTSQLLSSWRSPPWMTEVRLVCFPHSGGGPSAFSTWPQYFEDSQQSTGLTLAVLKGKGLKKDP